MINQNKTKIAVWLSVVMHLLSVLVSFMSTEGHTMFKPTQFQYNVKHFSLTFEN